MKKILSALIIDKHKDKHKYEDVVLDNAPEWFENTFDLSVIDNTQNVLSELDKNRGVDCIITIGDDLNFEPLNQMSFEFRKKWCHLQEFNVDNIIGCIENTFLYNVNRDRGEEKLFSIFTSIYNTPFKCIKRLYDSLLKQSYKNWNWWIIDDSPNNYVSDYIKKIRDPRITIFKNITNHGNIGFNKHMIAMMCDGDYLVEVDHDDELTEDCLAKLYECFENSNADFVYSDCLEVTADDIVYYGDDFSYGQGYYRTEEVNGVKYTLPITTSSINAKSIRGIHAMPNHVRCWEKNFYHKIGGHNIELSVIDDMDLMSRTFLYGRMAKVDKVLYIQHEDYANNENDRCNTTGKRFKEIQRINYYLQNKYDKLIHNRILELGFEDPIWDEEAQHSDIYKKIDREQLPSMDLTIIK